MRLAASLRYSLYAVTTILYGSGAVWLAARYSDAWQSRPESAAASMRVHGAAAMAILVIAGSAAALHAMSAWREGRNRASGLALSAMLVILMITGYCLYYTAGESARALASLSHWILGLALPLFLALHARFGRLSADGRF